MNDPASTRIPAPLAIVGVISDTHGLVRPAALDALADSHLIVHAGDVGSPGVIEALRSVAPLHAVRGNNDHGAWARSLPETLEVQVAGRLLYVLHSLADLRVDPAARGYAAVVSGHSHRPGANRRDGVLYVNPGSAGPRRFSLPVAVARIVVSATGLDAEIVELEA